MVDHVKMKKIETKTPVSYRRLRKILDKNL